MRRVTAASRCNPYMSSKLYGRLNEQLLLLLLLPMLLHENVDKGSLTYHDLFFRFCSKYYCRTRISSASILTGMSMDTAIGIVFHLQLLDKRCARMRNSSTELKDCISYKDIYVNNRYWRK
jgi:hypothetical protein